MTSLRTRLVVVFVGLALVVAGVIVFAVLEFSADQIMRLIMEGAETPDEAQVMFDQYVLRVLLIGAAVGVLVGSLAAWWLVRRVLRPLNRLTNATLAVAAGDLAARVAEPPDPELRQLARGLQSDGRDAGAGRGSPTSGWSRTWPTTAHTTHQPTWIHRSARRWRGRTEFRSAAHRP